MKAAQKELMALLISLASFAAFLFIFFVEAKKEPKECPAPARWEARYQQCLRRDLLKKVVIKVRAKQVSQHGRLSMHYCYTSSSAKEGCKKLDQTMSSNFARNLSITSSQVAGGQMLIDILLMKSPQGKQRLCRLYPKHELLADFELRLNGQQSISLENPAISLVPWQDGCVIKIDFEKILLELNQKTGSQSD